MREITINFTAQNIVSSYNLGKIGEHNATMLTVTPPEVLSGDSRTAMYRIAFGTGKDTVLTSSFTTTPIVVELWQQLTKHSRMSIQVIAYDTNGDFVGKSEKLTGFYFDASVEVVNEVNIEDNPDIVSEISANTAARHTHDNKEVLDKFGESEGEPTYNGEPIGGTALVEILQQGIYARYTATELIALYVEGKIFTYGGNLVTNIRTASNLFTFSVLEYEVYNSVKTPVLRSYSVNSSKQITQEADAKSQLFLPYSVNGKTFANANAVTLKAADITASAGWSPSDDKDLATKKYVDDNAGGTPDWSDIQNKPNFATVATSGDYDDLINKPTIPAAQEQADWNEADNTKVDYIKNKPTIPTAGTITSGSTGYATGGDVYTALQGVSGWVASATAPVDTSLLWIDTSDNTIEGLADADNSEY